MKQSLLVISSRTTYLQKNGMIQSNIQTNHNIYNEQKVCLAFPASFMLLSHGILLLHRCEDSVNHSRHCADCLCTLGVKQLVGNPMEGCQRVRLVWYRSWLLMVGTQIPTVLTWVVPQNLGCSTQMKHAAQFWKVQWSTVVLDSHREIVHVMWWCTSFPSSRVTTDLLLVSTLTETLHKVRGLINSLFLAIVPALA